MDVPAASVSVIIPARNEEKRLGRCLESLARLDYPPGRVEVIVVDNGSSDGTLNVARSFADRLNLRVVEQKYGPVSLLRNFGASLAGGEVLAFLDADCAVLPTWLGPLQELLSNPEIGAAGAWYMIPDGSSWVARAWERPLGRGRTVPFVPGGDLLVRRSLFQRLGGFDEALETNEDFEFCQRIAKAGLSVMAVPELAVFHFGEAQTLRAFFRKERWHGKHVLYVFRRELPKIGNLKAVAFALYSLICLAGLLAGALLWLMTGNQRIALWSLAALLAAAALASARDALRAGRPSLWLPLTILFLVYGVARAVCLLQPESWFAGRRRERIPYGGR